MLLGGPALLIVGICDAVCFVYHIYIKVWLDMILYHDIRKINDMSLFL